MLVRSLATGTLIVAVLALVVVATVLIMRKQGPHSDEKGCCKSCGYSWCEAKRSCVRPWEEPKGSPCTSELGGDGA